MHRWVRVRPHTAVECGGISKWKIPALVILSRHKWTPFPYFLPESRCFSSNILNNKNHTNLIIIIIHCEASWINNQGGSNHTNYNKKIEFPGTIIYIYIKEEKEREEKRKALQKKQKPLQNCRIIENKIKNQNKYIKWNTLNDNKLMKK